MPQLILIILLADCGWLFYRRFIRDAERLTTRTRQQERERETGAMGTLVKDPATGEYRVRREGE